MKYLLFIIAIFLSVNSFAQGSYSISGTVVDENNKPLKSATVFISGTEKMTLADDKGKFEFNAISPGTYQVSTTIMGYYPDTRNVIIKTAPVVLNIVLKVKSILLEDVVIGAGGNWAGFYKIFKSQFLGTSKNAEGCEILNPKVLSFNFNQKTGLLTAEADKFMIIENKSLGYKIHYLLKDFQFNIASNTAIYDGDTNFEQLDGSAGMKKVWDRNRLETYKGSFMHFLRSVYRNTTLKEGFITNRIYKAYLKPDNDLPMISLDERPLKFDSVTTVIDTSFIRLNCNLIYVTYDPKKAAALKPGNTITPVKKDVEMDDIKSSVIKLTSAEATIDNRGNYTDYRAFFIRGNLAAKRIGDQLPFEYQPPTN
ncbi:MAG: hypothetical protein JWR50_3311 [Mucilaginibacter sp.]|nr:hypothetical protein [Mucilaginibacter sp.]